MAKGFKFENGEIVKIKSCGKDGVVVARAYLVTHDEYCVRWEFDSGRTRTEWMLAEDLEHDTMPLDEVE